MKFDDEGHILISPRELQERAFADPDFLINHALLPGTPMAFTTYERYTQFIDYLTATTGIHPHHFLFRGSTKIGFLRTGTRCSDIIQAWNFEDTRTGSIKKDGTIATASLISLAACIASWRWRRH